MTKPMTINGRRGDRKFFNRQLWKLFLTAGLCTGVLPCLRSGADVTTLFYSSTSGVAGGTNYFVPSNTLAQVSYAFVGNTCMNLAVTAKGATALYYFNGHTLPTQSLPIVVGPAFIGFTNGDGCTAALSYFTVQTTPLSSLTNTVSSNYTAIPSTAVVIPNDSNGPVSIIMESSVDMVNWTAALPGTYGTTTSNRFFRVRAQR